MLILFDHGTPAPLQSFLTSHTVKKTKELGWDMLNNGELLRVAEKSSFEVFLTTDKSIRYQQISLTVLSLLWFSETLDGRWSNGMWNGSSQPWTRQCLAVTSK